MKRRSYIFVEGRTDRAFIMPLKELPEDDEEIGKKWYRAITVCGGKDRIKEQIERKVGKYIKDPPYLENVCIAILRDLDDGETAEQILQSFQDLFADLLAPRATENGRPIRFSEDANHNGLYSYHNDYYNLTVFLFIMQPLTIETEVGSLSFETGQLENYILQAAFDPNVLARFAHQAGLSAEQLREKVVNEFREVFEANGITPLQKDFVMAYMAAARFLKVKRTEDDAKFAEIVVQRLKKRSEDQLPELFAPFLHIIDQVAL